ncbi:hypothetical protein AMTRI_Chr02g222300 [Amborella trichopoda]
MALQQQLDKFKQQQEKCQSTLSSIANRAAPSKSTPLKPSSLPQKPSPLPQKPSPLPQKPSPATKFSGDTERLQQINSIRKSPVGAQMKRVLDLLLETRQALTPEQINEACYVDLNANKLVFDSLRKNVKVNYDGKRFSYKELKTAGQVWLLSNFDSQEDIVYPNDPKITIKVDDDIKLLFRSIELPRDMVDIEKDLQKNGMKPATNTAKRKAMAQIDGIIRSKPKTKKKRELSKRTKLTNAHLPELFRNLNGSDS